MTLHRVVLAIALLAGTTVGQTLHRVTVTVVDENGVAVPDARVILTAANGSQSIRCQTGPAGMCVFSVYPTSSVPYRARVEKENFYATESGDLKIDQTTNVELTLVHQREVREVVNVVESPPAINPEQVQAQEQISGIDVINLPYPTTRDYRNVLEYIPQVVNDIGGQPHITGAETYQSLVLFDGFNVTQPANGQLLLRVSTDAFRSIKVQTSRVSAEYGKNSGGVLELNTASGDDHYRFTTTDFIPSLQNKGGWTLDKWNPRFAVSGPISKGQAWFYDAIDGEYDNIIETALADRIRTGDLPPGSDHDVYWRIGNLIKVQGNVTPRNILTSDFDYNFARDEHAGLSKQNPAFSTPTVTQPMYQGGLKDQYYFPSGQLLETGFGFNRYDLDQVPSGGTGPYFVSPDTTGGTYYFTAQTTADRWQIFSNLFVKPVDWHGNHQFKIGIDADRLRYDFNFLRQPISYLSVTLPKGQSLPPGDCLQQPQPYACARFSEFPNQPISELHNSEYAGYAQDRWLVTNRFLVEAGLRFDWDQIIRDALFSPRLAGTYVLSESANTKFSAGIGVFHDATPVFLFSRPEAGQRTDFFYDSSGSPTAGPINSIFSVNRSNVEAPRYLNWSVGLEQKLPGQVYLKAEFIQKHGTNGFAYNWLNPLVLTTQCVNGCDAEFQLQNKRDDHFDSFEINLRRVFEKGYLIMGSYTRSKSHTSQVLDLSVDAPTFSGQVPGPYSWDAPNRFLSWGFLPLPSLPIIHHLDLAYSTEYRTGFPFYLVNDQQQLAPLHPGGQVPDFLRFPQYFTLNLHVEKRFHLFGAYWALRGGFDDITDRKNYAFVNNNVDAYPKDEPIHFAFSGFAGRAFTGRIRFLGRK